MGSSGHRLAAAALMGLTASFALPAAAETDADLSRYCRTTFPNSSPVTRAPSGAIAHYCNQGGTLQGVDLARACELTTGSRAYRQSGSRILCQDGPGAAAASDEALTAGDFVRYCRAKIPNSSYQHVPGNLAGQHTCRQVGWPVGFTLQPIDLADACRELKGASGYREESGRVLCESVARTAERRATGAGGSTRRDSSAPDRPRSPGTSDSDGKPDSANKTADRSGPADTVKRGSKTTETGARPEGVWEMTVGVLPGMKVRFDWSGDDTMEGKITELPPAAAATARSHFDLSVGDPVIVGRIRDGKLELRTRLGVFGTRTWMLANCSLSLADYERFVTNRWSLPGWFPVYRMTRTESEIKGQHGGNEFIGHRNAPTSRCVLYGDPFSPVIDSHNKRAFDQAGGPVRAAPIKLDPAIRVPKWAVKFELKSVNECREKPADVPPLGLTQLLQDKRNQALGAARAQLGQARP